MASHTEQHRGIRFTLERWPSDRWWVCRIHVPKALSGRPDTYRGMGGGGRRLLRRRAIRFIDVIVKAAGA